jgi:hypothetical protein
MGDVGDLVGPEGAAAAGVVGPAGHPRLEEGAVDDQLAAVFEQVEEASRALRTFELIRFLNRHPRHPPTLGRQPIPSSGERLLFHQHLEARRFPCLGRNDRWCFHESNLLRDVAFTA